MDVPALPCVTYTYIALIIAHIHYYAVTGADPAQGFRQGHGPALLLMSWSFVFQPVWSKAPAYFQW
jgi:hypothetical protein